MKTAGIVFVVLLVAVIVYVAINPELMSTQVDEGKTSVVWKFEDAGETEGMPRTTVVVTLNGTTYEAGTFVGSCSEIGETGGVDGTGFLAGELSAAQCWFAGGGNEIGVFAHEDGGYDIMVGELGEGEEGAGVFRGNFKIIETVLP